MHSYCLKSCCLPWCQGGLITLLTQGICLQGLLWYLLILCVVPDSQPHQKHHAVRAPMLNLKRLPLCLKPWPCDSSLGPVTQAAGYPCCLLFTHSLTHLLTQSITHSLTHSLNRSCSPHQRLLQLPAGKHLWVFCYMCINFWFDVQCRHSCGVHVPLLCHGSGCQEDIEGAQCHSSGGHCQICLRLF